MGKRAAADAEPAPANLLRVCLDRVSQFGSSSGGAVDVYAELFLDTTRGRRCEPLAVRTSASELFGLAADGYAFESAYHDAGVFSHRLSCSDFAEKSENEKDACSYAAPAAHIMRTYNATCDPKRSHCYSMAEHATSEVQPLWCCDFLEELALAAQYMKFVLHDESKVQDDRLGELSLAAPVAVAAARAAGSFGLTAPVNGSHPRMQLSVWAGFVKETSIAAEAANRNVKKHPTQISWWGAYGPYDVRLLSKANNKAAAEAAVETAPAMGAARRNRARAVQHSDAHRRAEWLAWQSLPLLGAAEQPRHVVTSRERLLRRMAGEAPEMGLHGSGVCVVSTATGAKYNGTTPLGAALLRNKRDFCSACGYRCLLSTTGEYTTPRPPKWDKLLAIHDALRSCSLVLHIDADVIIRQPFQLEPLAHTWLSATRDFDGLNSGVMLVKRTRQARELFDFAWRQESFNRSFSAEQNALRLGLRRPYKAPSRSRIALVSILEGLVEYSFFDSPLLGKLSHDLNVTAPLYHAAGCTAAANRVSSGKCDDTLLKELPPRPFSHCPAIEIPHVPKGRALNQHLQLTGPTSLGRRWMRGRDVRIKYTDQKGSKHDGWWEKHPGCSEVGCDDPDARGKKDPDKKLQREAKRKAVAE